MLISKFGNLNEKNIEEVKKLVDIPLPEQYLTFLMKYNGGETPDTNWNGKCRSDVEALFGYKVKDKMWDLESNLSYIAVEELLQEGFFPFGQNSFGDYFCIKVDGTIWFIYHDSDKRKQIAEDFKSFVQGCKSKKIGHIRTIEERTQCVWENHGIKPSEDLMRAWQDEIDRFSRIHQEEVVVD